MDIVIVGGWPKPSVYSSSQKRILQQQGRIESDSITLKTERCNLEPRVQAKRFRRGNTRRIRTSQRSRKNHDEGENDKKREDKLVTTLKKSGLMMNE